MGQKVNLNINLFYISNNKTNSDHEKKLLRRLKAPIKISLTRISVKKKFKSKFEQIEYEAKLLGSKIDLSKPFICFDRRGRKFSTIDFAQFLIKLNTETSLIIGGALGLSEHLKKQSKEIISLSDMEFSHEVFRIMVLEQLYRVSCVINNHPYQQIEK